jgi:septum formation protein
VLGSQSPRRHEILETLRIPHCVFAPAIDETRRSGEALDGYLERVVRGKLAAVDASLPTDLRACASAILVADTSVVLDDPVMGQLVLGKPEGTVDAALMMMRLAGATHEVHTRFAVAVLVPGGPRGQPARPAHEETVRTRVKFRPLTRARALAYAESGEGLDKAGGYAVQGLASGFVERIDGSYTNVVGLPACEVSVALEALGLL